MEKFFCSDLSKRRVIVDGVGGKSLLHKKDYDYVGQVAAQYDRVNNGLEHREMMDRAVPVLGRTKTVPG